ncbi:DUF6325 family protein [Nocardia sp. NPDC004168]|uniref:DUF6325 family protein n=1 Tax=Nocardia sp. NPDC004168 TaxID=3154452 RepID=UPI0033BEBB4F
MTAASNLGPVEVVVLTFPGMRMNEHVREGLSGVVEGGYVTVLDLVYLAKDANGYLRRVEIGEPLEEIGLAGVRVQGLGLLTEQDLAAVAGAMPVATSAVVVVYEQTWTRTIADQIAGCGGEIALHLQMRCPHSSCSADTSVASMILSARADTPGLLATSGATVVADGSGRTAHAITERTRHIAAAHTNLG